MGSEKPQLPTINFEGLDLNEPLGSNWETARTEVLAALKIYGCFDAVYDGVQPEVRHCSGCSDAYTAGLIKYRNPYPFGVDPSWRGSRTELPFLNSLKMKMSILLDITQMNLGIILSYFDAKFHGNSLDIRTPCEYNKNLSIRVEERSRKPGHLTIKFLYQGGQTDIMAVEVAQRNATLRRLRGLLMCK